MSTSVDLFNPLLEDGIQKLSTTAETIAGATLEPTGFEDGDNIDVAYSHTDRKITLTHSSGTIAWWWRGVRHTVASPWTSADHATTLGVWYLKLTGDITTEDWSQTPWVFSDVQIASANYQTLAVNSWALRETHMFMPWESHQNDHETIGTHRKTGLILTAGTFALNGTTDAQNSWGVDTGTIKDEDLTSSIAAWSEGTYTLLRRDGVNGTWLFNTTATLPFHVVSNSIQYNQNTGATWQLTAVPEDSFVNYYVIAVPTASDTDSQKHRIWVMPGQVTYTTLAAAQQEFLSNLDLGTLAELSPEFIGVVRVSMRYNASGGGSLSTTGRCNIAAQANLTGTRAIQVGQAGFTPADHSALSGLPGPNAHPIEAIGGDVAQAGRVVFTDAAGALDTDSELTYDPATDTLGLSGTVSVDTISEKTSAAGVTIDGVLLKDGVVGSAYGGTGLTALGTALQVLRTNAGATAIEWATAGGDVSGPSSAVDNELARFDQTTGKLIQATPTTPPTLSDTGILNINNATDATSTTDGSLQTDGGLSVVKSAFIGATATAVTSVVTPVVKAYDANGIKFQENGGGEVGSISDAGLVTLGASGGTQVHAVNGSLQPTVGYKGTNTGTAIPTGYVGEKVAFTAASISAVTTGFIAGDTPLYTLPAGRWMVVFFASVTGASSLTFVEFTVASNADDNATGVFSEGGTTVFGTASVSGLSGTYRFAATPLVIDVTTTQALYGKATTVGANTTVVVRGYAIRLD